MEQSIADLYYCILFWTLRCIFTLGMHLRFQKDVLCNVYSNAVPDHLISMRKNLNLEKEI